MIIIPFFTSCTGACPVMNQNLAKIQDWLGDRLGKDAHILSVSVDPSTDTVAALRAYAAQYNARPGWHFLGGTRENVALALKKLGRYVDAREDHTNLMIIGNERTGLWKKAFGLADSDALIGIVDSVLNDKGEIVRPAALHEDPATPRLDWNSEAKRSISAPRPRPAVKARIGVPPVDAPATLLACVNCHGRDGTGKPEGSVVPSDITWEALTKPYGVTHASGRTHQPYTERLLVRAICLGIDPAGHELHPTMPRFQMSREDADALIG